MKIYISGPITGIEDSKEKFETAEKRMSLKHPNAEIINPAKISLPESCTWNDYMVICLHLLNGADFIYMMQGWKKSPGACVEYGYAIASGMIIEGAGE